MPNQKQLLLRIADLGFLVHWKDLSLVQLSDDCYRGFLFQDKAIAQELPSIKRLIHVDVSGKKFTTNIKTKPIKYLPNFWKLYQTKNNYLLKSFHPTRKNILSYSLIRRDFSRIVYYPQPLSRAICRDYHVPYQKMMWMFLHLVQPVLRYCFTNTLGQGQGLLVHGCAVKYAGSGYIFVGPSGSGKTTLAGILQSQQENKVLTDENIALISIKKEIFVYGTPWPGGGRIAQSDHAPLKAICFICHAPKNYLKKISPTSARRKLLQDAVWDALSPEIITAKLDFLKHLLNKINCYELGFINNKITTKFLCRKLFRHKN